jgi:hypothetical protein
VRSALRTHAGNKLRAARELGISRCYLHRLLNQLRIVPVTLQEESEATAVEAGPASPPRSGLSIASRVA